MQELFFTVSDEYENERADKFLSESAEELSRSYLQKLIAGGDILLNDNPLKKPGVRLKTGDRINVNVPDNIIPDILPENIPLDILYEDEDVIVVNKPKGMVVHPAAGHYSGTLVNALLYHCAGNLSGINGVMRPGIVHRIDKDTTGSVIACKNDRAHQSIARQLKEHSIVRRYRLIVHGAIPDDEGTIRTFIGRDPKNRLKMAASERNGKEAVTHYKVLERFREYTYLECVLETGRTHQIRVHMAHINHPVLGDELYSNFKSPFKLEGQCLHAKILGFTHPGTGEYIETDAPFPDYFTHLLKIL